MYIYIYIYIYIYTNVPKRESWYLLAALESRQALHVVLLEPQVEHAPQLPQILNGFKG